MQRLKTRSGQTAVVFGQMPSGHWHGYVEDCSLVSGWTESGKQLMSCSDYDLVQMPMPENSKNADPLPETIKYPAAWMVIRDSEVDKPELFLSKEEADKNACLGVVDTHVVSLFRK